MLLLYPSARSRKEELVLRWGTNMPARSEPWLEKGEKIDVDVPQDLCLSNIFLMREDALDKAKVPAARRGRKTTNPSTSPSPCMPTLVGLPTVVSASSTSHSTGATPLEDGNHGAPTAHVPTEPARSGDCSNIQQIPADEASSSTKTDSQNGRGQEPDPDHHDPNTMAVDDADTADIV